MWASFKDYAGPEAEQVRTLLRSHGEAILPSQPGARRVKIRKRRLRYARTVLQRQSYFSDEAMEARAPALFQARLGHLLQDRARRDMNREAEVGYAFGEELSRRAREAVERVGPEAAAREPLLHEPSRLDTGPTGTLSGTLMRVAEQRALAARRFADGAFAPEGEGAGGEDDEEDEDEDEAEEESVEAGEMGVGVKRRRVMGGAAESGGEEEEDWGHDVERAREQLVEEMVRRFVEGKDAAYVDYARIDANAALDEDQEAEEERWFAVEATEGEEMGAGERRMQDNDDGSED